MAIESLQDLADAVARQDVDNVLIRECSPDDTLNVIQNIVKVADTTKMLPSQKLQQYTYKTCDELSVLLQELEDKVSEEPINAKEIKGISSQLRHLYMKRVITISNEIGAADMDATFIKQLQKYCGQLEKCLIFPEESGTVMMAITRQEMLCWKMRAERAEEVCAHQEAELRKATSFVG